MASEVERETVTLITEDQVRIRISKLWLENISEYFAAMFRSGMTEADKSEVHISEIPGSVLQTLVKSGGDTSAYLSATEAEQLIHYAAVFQFHRFLRRCWRALETDLCVGNCLTAWSLARRYANASLAQLVSRFVRYHAAEVHAHGLFVFASFENLLEFLGSDVVKLKDEGIVLDCAVQWVSGNVCTEQQQVQIWSSIRWRYIDEQQSSEALGKILPEQTILAEKVKSSCSACSVQREADKQTALRVPPLSPCVLRATVPSRAALTPASGDLGPTGVSWRSLEGGGNWGLVREPIPHLGDLQGYSCCMHEQRMWVSGGQWKAVGRGPWSDSVWVFDSILSRWREMSPLPLHRRHHGMLHHRGCLYVVAGFGQWRVKHTSLHVLREGAAEWEVCPEIPAHESAPTCAALSHRLVVIKTLVQVYDTQLLQWSIISSSTLTPSLPLPKVVAAVFLASESIMRVLFVEGGEVWSIEERKAGSGDDGEGWESEGVVGRSCAAELKMSLVGHLQLPEDMEDEVIVDGVAGGERGEKLFVLLASARLLVCDSDSLELVCSASVGSRTDRYNLTSFPDFSSRSSSEAGACRKKSN